MSLDYIATVVDMRQMGWSDGDILAWFPSFTQSMLDEAWAYYALNAAEVNAEIDRSLAEARAAVEGVKSIELVIVRGVAP